MDKFINKVLVSKKVVYSRHAKNRMRWRKISQADIALVLENPDNIKRSNTHKYTCFKNINNRQIKVVFVDNKEDTLIITAFDKAN